MVAKDNPLKHRSAPTSHASEEVDAKYAHEDNGDDYQNNLPPLLDRGGEEEEGKDDQVNENRGDQVENLRDKPPLGSTANLVSSVLDVAITYSSDVNSMASTKKARGGSMRKERNYNQHEDKDFSPNIRPITVSCSQSTLSSKSSADVVENIEGCADEHVMSIADKGDVLDRIIIIEKDFGSNASDKIDESNVETVSNDNAQAKVHTWRNRHNLLRDGTKKVMIVSSKAIGRNVASLALLLYGNRMYHKRYGSRMVQR
jgi:hypothetical protein